MNSTFIPGRLTRAISASDTPFGFPRENSALMTRSSADFAFSSVLSACIGSEKAATVYPDR